MLIGLTAAPGTYVAPAGQPLPFSLAGISVAVTAGAAPILAVVVPADRQAGTMQINFQVPMERNVSLELDSRGQPNVPGTLSVGGATIPLPPPPTWGGFFSDPSTNGYAIALHASDRSLV